MAVCENVDPEGEDVVQEDLFVAVEDLEGFTHARAIHHARRKDAVRLCAKIKRNGILLSLLPHFHANRARAARGSGPFVSLACATKETTAHVHCTLILSNRSSICVSREKTTLLTFVLSLGPGKADLDLDRQLGRHLEGCPDLVVPANSKKSIESRAAEKRARKVVNVMDACASPCQMRGRLFAALGRRTGCITTQKAYFKGSRVCDPTSWREPSGVRMT